MCVASSFFAVQTANDELYVYAQLVVPETTCDLDTAKEQMELWDNFPHIE